MAKKQLDTWIREALSDTEQDGACVAFVLVHMRGSGQEEIDVILGELADENDVENQDVA